MDTCIILCSLLLIKEYSHLLANFKTIFLFLNKALVFTSENMKTDCRFWTHLLMSLVKSQIYVEHNVYNESTTKFF